MLAVFRKTIILVVAIFAMPLMAQKPIEKRITLADLHLFLARYPDLKEFLKDPLQITRFRDDLKAYMGYDSEFDPIFDETLRQHRVLSEQIPGYDKKIWRIAARGEEPIVISGAKSQRSGIETHRVTLEAALEKTQEAYAKEAEPIFSLPIVDQRESLKRHYESLMFKIHLIEDKYPESLKRPASNAALRKLGRDPAQRQARKKYFEEIEKIKNDDEFKLVVATLRSSLLQREDWRDSYLRTFAEDSLGALNGLDSLDIAGVGISEILKTELNLEALDPYFTLIVSGTDSLYRRAKEDWQRAQNAKSVINQILTPREPLELVQEMNLIMQQNPDLQPHQVGERLSIDGKNKLKQFQVACEKTYLKKKEILSSAERSNLYRLPVTDLADQKVLELRRQVSEEFRVLPMHAFIASFSGGKTKECVGGANACTLTPRRTALSALDGVRSYAVERGAEFDGAVRLVAVSPDGQKSKYEAVDMMVNAIASTVEIRSETTGQSAKYPLFDAILDPLTLSQDSLGFVAGDGRAISQNTGLAKVVETSPSVVSSVSFNAAIRFSPIDEALSHAINAIFPKVFHGYNPGGMIFEGMPSDGQKRFVLVPRKSRPKFQRHDLEVQLYEDRIAGGDASQSIAWGQAVESDVKLHELSFYQNVQTQQELNPLKMAFQKLIARNSERPFIFLLEPAGVRLSADFVREILPEKTLMEAISFSLGSARAVFKLLLTDNRLDPSIIENVLSRSALEETADYMHHFYTGINQGKLDDDHRKILERVLDKIIANPNPQIRKSCYDGLLRGAQIDPRIINKYLTKEVLSGYSSSPDFEQRNIFYGFMHRSGRVLDPNILAGALKVAATSDKPTVVMHTYEFLQSAGVPSAVRAAFADSVTIEKAATYVEAGKPGSPGARMVRKSVAKFLKGDLSADLPTSITAEALYAQAKSSDDLVRVEGLQDFFLDTPHLKLAAVEQALKLASNSLGQPFFTLLSLARFRFQKSEGWKILINKFITIEILKRLASSEEKENRLQAYSLTAADIDLNPDTATEFFKWLPTSSYWKEDSEGEKVESIVKIKSVVDGLARKNNFPTLLDKNSATTAPELEESIQLKGLKACKNWLFRIGKGLAWKPSSR